MIRLFPLLLLSGAILAVASGQNTLPDQIRSAQAARDYTRAAQLYQQLIATGTDTPEIRTNFGIMLHLAGRNSEALSEFQHALRRNPSLTSANLFAGLSAFDLGQYQGALPYLQRANELNPADPIVVITVAKTYLALRHYKEANEAYKRVTTMAPRSAEGWFGQGVTARAMADSLLNQAVRKGTAGSAQVKKSVKDLLDEALQSLSRALELEPNSARTRLLKAEALSDQGNFAEAVSEYREVLRIDPSLEGAYLGLATEYWKQRQFDQAVPLLKHLLQREPTDPEANGIMADIAEHGGENAKAEQYASVALKGNPNLIETRVVLARVYLSEQKPARAISELKQIAAADTDGSYHYLLYRAYHQAGDEAAAKAALTEYQRRRPSGNQ